ncbi:apoptosis-associated speck-like protein containing a CARD [Syngnathus typhle]
MRTKTDIVKEVLEDLSKQDFEMFCDALVHRPGDIKVAKNQVQDKGCIDVSNAVVSTFSEDGTPAVVIELLKSINLCDEAYKLGNLIAKHFPKSSASKATAATACSSEEHFVIKHKMRLIESVTNVDAILRCLLEKKVIQDDDYDEICDTKGNEEKMTKIYGLVLKSGIRAKEIFFEILKAQEPFLVEELENKA